MVMRRRWHRLALVLLLAAPGLRAAPLSVGFPATGLEMGRPARVVVQADGPRPSLEALDLSPWSAWFMVERRGEVQPALHGGGQSQVIWLVPRATGPARLPPLSLGERRGGGQTVRIAPARDPRDGEHIVPGYPQLPPRAWQRQQLIYAVSLVSRHRYLQLTAEPAELEGVESLPIPQQVEAIGDGPDRRYRHTAGWLLFPTRAGTQRLQLPALRYGREGVNSHRFYPPPLEIEVRHLPGYLPPGVAVGRITLEGMRRPWLPVRRGELQTRRFSIVVRGVPAKWWRPPELVVDGAGAVRLFEAGSRPETRIDATGLTVRYRYALPLSIRDSGWHSLSGGSRLYAFDPASGKLQARQLRVALPLSLYLWQQGILGLLSLWAIWFTGRRLMGLVRRRYEYLSAYRLALRGLEGVDSPGSLRDVLALVAAAEGWRPNLSLSEWLSHWGPGEGIAGFMLTLERALYGGGEFRPRQMAQQLSRILRQRLGPWQWVCGVRLGDQTGP